MPRKKSPASISRVARAIEVAAKSNPNRYRDDPFGLSAEAALEAISPDERLIEALTAISNLDGKNYDSDRAWALAMQLYASVALKGWLGSTTKADQ